MKEPEITCVFDTLEMLRTKSTEEVLAFLLPIARYVVERTGAEELAAQAAGVPIHSHHFPPAEQVCQQLAFAVPLIMAHQQAMELARSGWLILTIANEAARLRAAE